MINIHIIGDGSYLYAVKTILEVNQDKFDDEIEVTCFGDHYLNPIYIKKLSKHLTIDDIVRKADVVICTNPDYQEENLVNICKQYSIPLFCTFELEDKIETSESIVLDNINVQMAATDLWIKRLLDVTENLKEIKHYIGISKTHDTGDNSLPGLTIEEYQQATDRVLGQPNLIRLESKYYFASDIEDWQEDGADIKTHWIVDNDRIDASKISMDTNTIFHTAVTSYDTKTQEVMIRHSHKVIPGARSLSSWNYANACVLGSFIHMWSKGFIPKQCVDYMQLDHDTFSKNTFGAIFRIA